MCVDKRSYVEIVHDAIAPFAKNPSHENWETLSERIRAIKSEPETSKWVDVIQHRNQESIAAIIKLKQSNGVYYAR